MGDKIEAKNSAEKLGLPLVPGSPGPLHSVAEARKIAAEIGYPVLIKDRGHIAADRAVETPQTLPGKLALLLAAEASPQPDRTGRHGY
jgi:biotin carboxylase